MIGQMQFQKVFHNLDFLRCERINAMSAIVLLTHAPCVRLTVFAPGDFPLPFPLTFLFSRAAFAGWFMLLVAVVYRWRIVVSLL